MKAEKLQSPFTWDQRKVLIEDSVWYIPKLCKDYTSFSFPGWSHPDLFEQERPICVEYCSGNGAWIASKAQAFPEYNWVAVELKFDRVRKIWSKIKKHSLSNLLIACGEGYFTTKHYLPSLSVKSVFINFPDPWPKTRHAKNRIVQVPFVKEIYRILQVGGTFTLVTDDEAYSQI